MGEVELKPYNGNAVVNSKLPKIQESDLDELEQASFKRWQEMIVVAIGSNNLEKLKQCYSHPWLLAGQIDLLPVEHRLIPPLVEAVLMGKTHLGIIKFLMSECKHRLSLPHEASCLCSSCLALQEDATFRNQYISRTLKAMSSPIYIYSKTADEDIIQFCLNLKQKLLEFHARFNPLKELNAGNLCWGYNACTSILLNPFIGDDQYQTKYGINSLTKSMESLDDTVCMLLDECKNDEEAIGLLVTFNANEFEELNSTTRLTRNCLKLYRFSKLNMKNSLCHPTSQSILDKLWLHQWSKMKSRAKINSPFCHGLFARIGTPILLFVMFLIYIIVVPLAIIFPLPGVSFFIKNPRSKYYLDFIAEILFQALLYFFVYHTIDGGYYLVIERMCNFNNFQHYSQTYMGVTIIVYLFLTGKILKHAIKLSEIIGEHTSNCGSDLLNWIEHTSYALLLAGLSLDFVWLYQMNEAINLAKTDTLRCLCEASVKIFSPFCNANSFSCSQVSGLNKHFYAQVMSDLLYVNQLSKVLLTTGCIFNAIALPHVLSHLHVWVYALCTKIRQFIRTTLVVTIFIVLIAAFTSLLILFVTGHIQQDCENPRNLSLPFSHMNSAMMTLFLYWTRLKTLISQNDIQIKIASVNQTMQNIVSMGNTYLLVLFIIFIITMYLVLFQCFISLMKQSIYSPNDNVLHDWVLKRSQVQLEYLCKGCEPPIPFNLLHPIYLFTSLIIRKIYEAAYVETWQHGGVSDPLDSFIDFRVPNYKESQSRCRTRVLAKYLHEEVLTN